MNSNLEKLEIGRFHKAVVSVTLLEKQVKQQ